MSNNRKELQKSFPDRLKALCCVWFLVGMLLSMLLSGISSFASLPSPPSLFFLTGMTYLSGGLLGSTWSGENLCKRDLPYVKLWLALFVLAISIGLLLLGMLFVVIGYRHAVPFS